MTKPSVVSDLERKVEKIMVRDCLEEFIEHLTY